jgi:Flp pilus assembly pilin Flp
MRSVVFRLFTDDRGQDLIEYALLTGLIGFAGILAFDLIMTAIGNTYGSQETAINSLWEPPAPAGGS